MNKIASAILFDVGCKKLAIQEDSYFYQSKRCLSRLILRKMFSEDNDEMGVILFGSEETDHCMPDNDNYPCIRELGPFGKPNFSLFDKVEAVTQCKGYRSDWARAIIVALEYLRKGVQGKRYKMRQIVIFSEFPTRLDYNEPMFNTIANCLKDLKVNLTVVSPELDLENENEIPEGYQVMIEFLKLTEDPLQLSIDELAGSIKYFEKKRKTKRVFNVDLEIGSKIKIPVGWVKLTSESQRFANWVSKQVLIETKETPSDKFIEASSSNMELEEDSEVSSFKYKDPAEDVFKVAKFGKTEVTLSSADLAALKRESGPPTFKILVFCHKSFINPTFYIGNDIFGVTPREKSNYSQAKLYALIDAMKEKNKVAVARRIVMKNGKVQIGILIPFSDECGKHLYFLKLPTAEWAQPFPRHRANPVVDSSLKQLFETFVENMTCKDDLVEGAQGLVIPNPHFQLRCQLFSDRALNPSCDITKIPDYISQIIDPFPEMKERTKNIVNNISKVLPSLNSIKRKDETEKRALSRTAKKTYAASNKVKQEKAQTSDSSETSFATADSNVVIKDEQMNTCKDEVKVEEDDIEQLGSLINQLAHDIDVNATDILEEVE